MLRAAAAAGKLCIILRAFSTHNASILAIARCSSSSRSWWWCWLWSICEFDKLVGNFLGCCFWSNIDNERVKMLAQAWTNLCFSNCGHLRDYHGLFPKAKATHLQKLRLSNFLCSRCCSVVTDKNKVHLNWSCIVSFISITKAVVVYFFLGSAWKKRSHCVVIYYGRTNPIARQILWADCNLLSKMESLVAKCMPLSASAMM